jgi:hypothetical protein
MILLANPGSGQEINFLAKSESPLKRAEDHRQSIPAQFIGLSLLAAKFISARPQGLTKALLNLELLLV